MSGAQGTLFAESQRHHWQTSDRAATIRRWITAICCGYGGDAQSSSGSAAITPRFQSHWCSRFHPARCATPPIAPI